MDIFIFLVLIGFKTDAEIDKNFDYFYQSKFLVAWGIFSSFIVIMPYFVINLLGSLIGLYVIRMLLEPEIFPVFGKKLCNIPIYISILMIITILMDIGNIFGVFLTLILLGVQILFLFYVYKKNDLYASLS